VIPISHAGQLRCLSVHLAGKYKLYISLNVDSCSIASYYLQPEEGLQLYIMLELKLNQILEYKMNGIK